MRIPEDWVEYIVDSLVKITKDLSYIRSDKDSIKEIVNEYLFSDFNKNWELPSPLSQETYDNFKRFLILNSIHQCNKNTHPLTCGVGGGTHDILVPRISYKGELYLVCPTCGWIQHF